MSNVTGWTSSTDYAQKSPRSLLQGALWWDNNDLGVAPKTANVGITITSTILAQTGQVRSPLESTQRVNVDGLVS